MPREQPAAPLHVGLDPDQARALAAAGERDVLVVGGPGTGKTSLVVRGVWEQVRRGTPLSRMVVLTHTRPAAQALRTQIIHTLGGAELAPAVMTPHALAHGLVRRFGDHGVTGRAPLLLTAPEQEFRVRELLTHTDTSAWPADLAAAAMTRGFATEVRTATARVRHLGLDPVDVAALADQAQRPPWRVLAEFFDEYLDVLDEENVVDYAELVHRARLVMARPDVASAWAAEVQQVWCDDMGEFDPSQLQLVADLSRVGARVFGAADPWTGVFGFRGADERLVLDFASLFGGGTHPAPLRVSLTHNHRNSRAVAQVVASTAHRLPRPGDFHPGKEPVTAPLGSATLLVTDSPGAEAEHIVHTLRKARLEHGLEWCDMAVITRSTRGSLPLLARVLSSHGVPVQMAGDEVALSEAMAVAPLTKALRLVLTPPESWAPDQALDLLRSPLGGLHGLAIRRLGRRLRAAGGTAGKILSTADWCAEVLREPETHAGPDVGADLAAAVALGRLLHRCRGLVMSQASAAHVLWELWAGTGWPRRLHHEAVSGVESAPRANRDLDAVCALFDVANAQSAWVGERGVRALLAEVQAQQIPADHARESDPRARGVTLTTAHRVKGASWPLVVVAGLQEGVWPATRRRGTLLDASRLTRGGLTEAEPFSSLVAAERRLFLLAVSRARHELVLTCVSGTEGEGDQPSRFLVEVDLPATRVLGRPDRPLTVPGLVAELRRAATDPEASPALRTAAATRLAKLSMATDHVGRQLAPDADPRRWWGVLDYSDPNVPVVPATSPVVLGGSELEMLMTCPRRWFLSRQAHAESRRGSASSLGSVIHVLVEHASAEGLQPETLHAHLDEVWDQIPFDAAWLSASERSEAEAALERYARWDRAGRRTVVGAEVRFEVDLDLGDEQVTLRGTVDRLEVDEQGRVHVVDFKTGRTAPTKAEAERSPQLGLYQLATQLGAFADLTNGSNRPGGAELVYLRQGMASGAPKVLTQPSLADVPHLDESSGSPSWPSQSPNWPSQSPNWPSQSPNWMVDVVSEAITTIRSEQFDARACAGCSHCPFASSCPARSVSKEVGG